MSFSNKIIVGARDSALSVAQVEEVAKEFNLCFDPIYIKTTGDLDKKTSLRTLDKTNFFTKEIDELLLEGKCDLAIHSAKDLPDPLPRGLELAYLTKGLDPRDALVYSSLGTGARIATSSLRREENVRKILKDVLFVDIRGTIEERLEKIAKGEIEGCVIAEAALLRLKLDPQRLFLPGVTAPLQGRLALVVREGESACIRIILRAGKLNASFT